MRTRIMLALIACAASAQAVVIDRIAVSIGKQVILESDVARDLRITAFLDQKPVETSGDAKRKAAERLVDQILILREATENRVVLPGDAEGDRLLDQVRAQYASPAEYEAALQRYQIAESDLRAHLLAGFRTLRFTELRFRPEVQVSDEELRDYYQFLAAGWRRGQNAQVPTFEESHDQVEKLLVEQKVMQALDAWLSSTRTQVGLIYREPVFE